MNIQNCVISLYIMNQIPLKNRKGEITSYTIVSPEDYEELSKFKWYNNYGYVKGNGNWKLHRYIMMEILKKEIPKGYVVDHENNDPLDNRRENLNIITLSQNARNRKKKENTSSKYIGVFVKGNVFGVAIRLPNKTLRAQYTNEIHAAHQYNLWVDEYNLITAKKNKIEIPKDFILHVKKEKRDLPNGIFISQNRYVVSIIIDKNKNQISRRFKTLEEAIECRKILEIEKEEYKKNQILSIPKMYNEKNECIFKIKDTEVIIDEELFYDIVKYKWNINKKNYAHARINEIDISLSRFVLNYSGELLVDHKNGNRLDNRKDNLRIVTAQQNAQNKSSAKGSSSQYVGVYKVKDKEKWTASIKVNDLKINIGIFNTEIEAANARDIVANKYNGEFAKINLTENINN